MAQLMPLPLTVSCFSKIQTGLAFPDKGPLNGCECACITNPEHDLCDGTVSVRLSVPAWAHSKKSAAAGLLLWAQRAGDIDRLLLSLQQQRLANA